MAKEAIERTRKLYEANMAMIKESKEQFPQGKELLKPKSDTSTMHDEGDDDEDEMPF